MSSESCGVADGDIVASDSVTSANYGVVVYGVDSGYALAD